MRKNRAAALSAVVILFSVFVPNSATATTRNSNTATVNDTNKTFKSAMEKFKQDQKDFLEAIKAYESARRAINKTFKESVDKALSDARSQSGPGQTQLQKRQGAVAKQSAVIAATAIRDAAIEELGPAPVPPTPPAKSQRTEKSKKLQSGLWQNPTSN